MATYYIDPNTEIGGDGSSPERAARDYRALDVRAGDSVLFRRGSIIRDKLDTVSGEPGAPVTYGAWGEGAAPIFSASLDISSPDDWVDEGGGVWSCSRAFHGEVGNLIFNGTECSATLRWEREGLVGLGDFYDEAFGCRAERPAGAKLYLFSGENPARVFSSIEAAQFGNYRHSKIKRHTIYEDLEFINSGVHAIQGNDGVGVTVRRCTFRRIGGCVWSRELRIRFGNCVEFWNIGEDVLIEDCLFEDVYDSCITHQGGDAVLPARNFICRRNRFRRYGMAAFEYRDRLPIDSSFTDNDCEGAGVGFAMLGETMPRRSEIWPQPMGHHIFLWRIEAASEGSRLEIRDNRFGEAPVGAAIYSIISPDAEACISFSGNKYAPANPILSVFFGNRVYADGNEWERNKVEN